MAFSSYAADLATKGWLSDSRQLVVKGWLVKITVEPVPPPDKDVGTLSGGILPIDEIPYKEVPKNKKLIKITVEYNNQRYTEIKEVNKKLKVTAKDIDVDIVEGKKPLIEVRVKT